MSEMATVTELTPQQRYSAGLREVADWYDAHPGAPLPLSDGSIRVAIYQFDATPDELKRIGPGRKDYPEGYEIFRYCIDLPHAAIAFVASRSKVCTPKVIGYREIPEKYVEAQVIPAKREEIIEWECRESLLKTDEDIARDIAEEEDREEREAHSQFGVGA